MTDTRASGEVSIDMAGKDIRFHTAFTGETTWAQAKVDEMLKTFMDMMAASLDKPNVR